MWWETVGCERPSGSIRLQTQTGSAAVASVFTIRTREGSPSLEQLGSCFSFRVGQGRRRQRAQQTTASSAAVMRTGIGQALSLPSSNISIFFNVSKNV